MKKVFFLNMFILLFVGCEVNSKKDKPEEKQVIENQLKSYLTKQQIIDSINKTKDNMLVYRILFENNDTICKYELEFENMAVKEHAMSDYDFRNLLSDPNAKPVGSVKVAQLVELSKNYSCYEKYFHFTLNSGKISTDMMDFNLNADTFYSIPLVKSFYKQDPNARLEFYISNKNKLIFTSFVNGKLSGFFDYSDRPKSNL